MANTYTQLYVHIVFGVRGRHALLPEPALERVHRYMSGVVANKEAKLLAIGGRPDHTHLLVGLNPVQPISHLVRDVKANSSRFIRTSGFVRGRFAWQRGYGAFSHSRSELPRVIRYIRRQREHHAFQCFREEYLKLLKEAGIEPDIRYLLDETT